MHEYDTALKLALREHAEETLRALVGAPVVRWHNVELPEVRASRVDLLGETADGELVHIELQSTNDQEMALRMAEYCLSTYRKLNKLPEQIVLYVGEDRMSMPSELRGRRVAFSHRQVDIRELDGERLLASEHIGDNVIAILASLRDQIGAVRRVVTKIAGLPPEHRSAVLNELMILAGLRRLDAMIKEEVKKVPILNDLLEDSVLGQEYKKGRIDSLRELLEQRFGPLPEWASEKLASRTVPELRDLGVRLLKAQSLEEVLR